MPDSVFIAFPGTRFAPLRVPCHASLALHLTVRNSPILFGCRTGICGTCLSRVEGTLPPPGPGEQELLDLLAPGDPLARLCCQLDLTSDIAVVAVED